MSSNSSIEKKVLDEFAQRTGYANWRDLFKISQLQTNPFRFKCVDVEKAAALAVAETCKKNEADSQLLRHFKTKAELLQKEYDRLKLERDNVEASARASERQKVLGEIEKVNKEIQNTPLKIDFTSFQKEVYEQVSLPTIKIVLEELKSRLSKSEEKN